MQNSKIYSSKKFALSLLIGAITTCSFTQSFSLNSSDYTCVKAPATPTPPPLNFHGLLNNTNKSVNERVCPEGEVPQPYADPQNQLKGLPPLALPNASLKSGLKKLLDFRYVYTYRYADNIGSTAQFSQHKPYLNPADYHSLAELSVMSADTLQIAEIGWTVDRGLNGDDSPHLFVFTWVNKQPNCYNGCGYVQVSPTKRPGMRVAEDGSIHNFAMMYANGNWWLNYDGEWIGYFPETIWTSKGVSFNHSGLVEWFGEVAHNTGTGTQMGNGTFGSSPGAATINNPMLILANGSSIPAGWTSGMSHPACYNIGAPGVNASYGGPGC